MGLLPLEIISAPKFILPRCDLCQLDKQCKSPKMKVTGKGKKQILLIGEAPGSSEDIQGRQFVGKSGQYLETVLRRAGIEMRQDCWLTNALRCHPRGNEIPDEKAIEYCRPFLIESIKELNPVVIILLGGVPVASLIGWLWKEGVEGIYKWAGWQIPSQRLNAWICPTFHPAHILRNTNSREEEDQVLAMKFAEHIEAAVQKTSRPWKEVPDYRKDVRIIHESKEAAKAIRAIQNKGIETAFDYETDRLKPDRKDSRIICAAVSNGESTVVYPWIGDSIKASKELLLSGLPIIASNAKFEERWTMRHLGISIKNWYWDTMLNSHILDNRQGITSIKFQSFVRLGQESYDDHIKPYLRAEGSNSPNRIRELDLSKLMLYCGLDALLEWLVAQEQKEELGYA